MKTIKMAVLAAIVLLWAPALISQEEHGGRPTPEQKEKLKAHKIAFITDRLQLTPEEAEKFWPVYNENEATLEARHKEFRKKHNIEPEDFEKMSDADAIALIDDHLKNEQAELDQQKQFIVKLKSVIPPKKILMLMDAERDFRVEVVRKVSGKDGPPLPYDQERMAPPQKK